MVVVLRKAAVCVSVSVKAAEPTLRVRALAAVRCQAVQCNPVPPPARKQRMAALPHVTACCKGSRAATLQYAVYCPGPHSGQIQLFIFSALIAVIFVHRPQNHRSHWSQAIQNSFWL